MEEKTYSTLAYLQAVQVLKKNLTMDKVFPTLREDVEAILADRELLISLFASRVVNGLETMESVPEDIREDVDTFLGQQSTSILLLVADIIDGSKTIEDIPENLRTTVLIEVERYLGKKIS